MGYPPFLKNEYRLSGTVCIGPLPPLEAILGGGGVVGYPISNNC